MLLLKNIRKNYLSGDSEVTALKDVSIEFRKNEFVSILGPSGCGKTTLLNIIGGLDRYTRGDLSINGVSTTRYRESDWDNYRNHSVGFVFQSYNLIPHQSVLSNVELALTLSGVSKAERRRRAEDVLKKVGLGDQLKKKPNQMSGGQMQRVAIARALVNDPEILLADEPTGALDSETSIQVMEILKEISKDRLIIMVTHNPELAELYSSRTVKLLDGIIVNDSDPYNSEDNKNASSDVGLKTSAAPAGDRAPASGHTKKMNKKTKKKSMSFFTALSLSLNNLMTKKARTFLTSFAGSIGIIGIALILAISSGINNYIATIQEETLASYPISITSETTDLTSLMTSMMSINNESSTHENDAVYSSAVMYQLMNLLNNEAISNDLESFKAFLDGEMKDGSDTELYKYVSAILYSYNININAYATDSEGRYVKSDIMSLFSTLMGSMAGADEYTSSMAGMSMMSGSAFALWEQMLPPSDSDGSVLVSDMITSQYELLDGKWPESSDEVVLILNQNNEVSDLVLYSLGLKSIEDMTSIMAAVSRGEQVSTEIQSWQYSEILNNIKFKLINDSDYYLDTNKDGIYENIQSDKDLLNTVIKNGKTLRISGIIKPKEDASFAILSGALGYTEALSREIISSILDSAVVKAQLANERYDVLTGLPFYLESNLTNEEKTAKFKEYCTELTDAQKRTLYGQMISALTDEEINATIDAYISGFESKDALIDAIIEEMAAKLGLDPEVLKSSIDYSEFTDDAIRKLLTENLKASADPEAAIAGILEKPTQAELDAIVASSLAMIKLQPGMQDIDELTAKKMLIAAYYQRLTAMSPEFISGYIATLSEENIETIVLNLAESQYSAATLTVDQQNTKIAAVFDAYIASLSDAELALGYSRFTEISKSTFDTNKKLFGVTSPDTPYMINIYTKSFEAKDKVAGVISDYNDGHDDSKKIVYTDYVALIMSSVTDIVNAISYVLIAFVSISLVVSSIMIGIITYISVLERTKEIGILRSIGASKKDISRVFNAETLIVGFTAGLIGIITTVILCFPINAIIHALTDIYEINAALPVIGGLVLLGVSMLLTLVAGLIPSKIAAGKDPVVALRSE